MKRTLSLLFLANFLTAQTYSVGDTVKDFSKSICSNGEGDLAFYSYNAAANGGEHRIIWINFFTSWCGSCQAEAPTTETIYQKYEEDGLIVIGAGADWGQPYNCTQWANKFKLTYPLLDDTGFNLFFEFAWDGSSQAGNQYYVPMNIIIDHDMVVRYREYGFNESAVKKKIEELIEVLPAVSVVDELFEPTLPASLELHDVYPNPFNPSTTLGFTLPQPAVVDVIIYNSLGGEVARLASGAHFEPGRHQMRWNAGDLPSGVYLIRVETTRASRTTKAILLR